MKEFIKIIDKILDRSRLEPASRCWIWIGQKQRQGYGKLYIGSHRYMLAHRAAYWAFCGDLPPDLDVLHRCDVPACVNPNHLWLGTQADNNRDMMGKGRASCLRGAAHGRAKLTEEQVRNIRETTAALRPGRTRIRSAGTYSQEEFARLYGVSPRAIDKVLRRENWRVTP